MPAFSDDTSDTFAEALSAVPAGSPVSGVTGRMLEQFTGCDPDTGHPPPPERQLASALGVGRSAGRETLAALEILPIGLGSVSLSHINDSGFWIATKFLGLSVADGLRTWTVLTSVLGFTSMLLLSLVWLVV